MAASIAICTLTAIERTSPAHSTLSRKIKKVEDAITELAALNKSSLNQEMRDLGIKAWSKAMDYVSNNIKVMVETVPNSKGGK